MSQELMDHYKALGEHYNNKASRIVMEAYMLGRRDARKKIDSKVGDLISRQAVLNSFDESFFWEIGVIKRKIEKLPSVEPKQGKWISHHHGCEYECSECQDKQRARSKYCPNCGAKMVEP